MITADLTKAIINQEDDIISLNDKSVQLDKNSFRTNKGESLKRILAMFRPEPLCVDTAGARAMGCSSGFACAGEPRSNNGQLYALLTHLREPRLCYLTSVRSVLMAPSPYKEGRL